MRRIPAAVLFFFKDQIDAADSNRISRIQHHVSHRTGIDFNSSRRGCRDLEAGFVPTDTTVHWSHIGFRNADIVK